MPHTRLSAHFLEFGIKNFGFGFPLLIKRDKTDPTKIIKAPLFIWNLDIERSYQNKNTWFIKRDEDYSIKLNELLISHLAKEGIICPLSHTMKYSLVGSSKLFPPQTI